MTDTDSTAAARVGIIAAMKNEISLLLETIEAPVEREHAGKTYVAGRIAGKDVAVVAAGLGKVRAAMAAQSLIDLFGVTSMFCIGMAGGIEPRLIPGDIVIASEVAQHDYDLSGGSSFIGIFTDRVGATLVKCDESLIAQARDAAQRLGKTRVFMGRMLTGDAPVVKREKKEALYRDFGGLCVDMEGAAIGAVCAANGVPFLVIRGISDKAEGLVLLDFRKNLTRVAPLPQQLIIEMLRAQS
jgi:adenosylhomocysteine nucleosidase